MELSIALRHARHLLLAIMLITAPRAWAQEPLVLRNVRVIDGTGIPAAAEHSIVVANGRIAEIGADARVHAPVGARVVDCRGKYLIPGLWDMHVHWYDPSSLGLFVANGVTGARQMFGSPVHLRWRDTTGAADNHVPRQFLAGPIVDGPRPIWPGSIVVTTAEDGREAVRDVHASGYDFVKVYNRVPRDAYFAIADEAKRLGVPFCGHVPRSVTAQEASDAGQKSIEHLDGVLLACSSASEEIAAERARARPGPTGIDSAIRTAWRSADERTLATYDAEKANRLFARFARNGTWQCPTLTANRMTAMLGDSAFRADPRLRYVTKSLREEWQPENDGFFRSMNAKDYAVARRIFEKQKQIVGEMRRAGVSFLAGTDVLNPYCFPGFSLHDELELLVEAGLSPGEALRAATLNAATWCGLADSVGTIAAGKLADLVLLDADPLERIGNTRRIFAVVSRGRWISRAGLDAILARVEELAGGDASGRREH